MAKLDFKITGGAALGDLGRDILPYSGSPPIVARRRRLLKLSNRIQRDGVPDPTAPPWNGVALLNVYVAGRYHGHSTGFFVKSNLLITAAHTLQLADMNAVAIFPAYDARSNPTKNVSGLAWAWHSSRDVAAIVTSLPSRGAFDIGGALPREATLAGYAISYDDNGHRMTSSKGSCKLVDHQLQYDIGAFRGDSGSPVFVSDPSGDNRVLAIHSDTKLATTASGTIGVGEFANIHLMEIIQELEITAKSYLRNG